MNYTLKKNKKDLFELLVGYSCNANCRFCSIDPKKRGIDSTKKELLNSIYKAKKDGCKYLGIGGGEPTIRRDLGGLISLAKKLNYDVIRIETNGIALSYLDYCKSLVDAGLDFVKLSVHGHNSKIHDFLTRVPGSFISVLKAIDNLQKLQVRIEINSVLNKVNYKFYPEFVKLFANKGIGSFCFIYPLYTGRMAENWSQIGIGIKELMPHLRKTLRLVDRLELDRRLIFNIPRCFMSGYEKGIIEEYNMRLSAPGLLVNDSDADLKASKIKLGICSNCKDDNRCGGVWREYFQLFGKKDFE
jgi:MoaA/NifB/PqqE/SkfB family radical SAM enzyme